jgi:Mg-chelatase subunit ChlD
MTSFAAYVALVAALCAALLVAPAAAAGELLAEIVVKEKALDEISVLAEALHVDRCLDLQACVGTNPTTPCTVPACGNGFPASRGYSCTDKWGMDAAMCRATCPGLVRSLSDTVVRIPPFADFNDGDMQAFICSTVQLVPKFEELLAAERLTAWQYMGHQSGAIRIYPGAAQGRDDTCSPYDTRIRPWYIAASSGPKDVIIIVDKSGSMLREHSEDGEHTRMSTAIAATQALLGTMVPNDFVSVIAMDDVADVIGEYGGAAPTLLRATTENLAMLSSNVSALTAQGKTSFVTAFDRAFDLFNTTGDATSNCSRIIILLTDGIDNDGNPTVANRIAEGQARLADRKAHIFTLSVTNTDIDAVPKSIACANNGVWMKLAAKIDPLTQMDAYYGFLASQVNSNATRWTAPYEDAFGLGQMVTGARVIYDRTLATPTLVGVLGTDILMGDFNKFSDAASILAALIERGKECAALVPSQCQLQGMRALAGYECPNQPSSTSTTCSSSSSSSGSLQKCVTTSNVNDMLCEQLSPTTRLPASFESTAAVTCCKDAALCNGAAAFSAVPVALAAAAMLLLW